MFYSLVSLILTYLIFLWSLEWVKYYNKQDRRLGSSVWRWSYDYPVIGIRDISMLDDKKKLLRRKRNRAVTYWRNIFWVLLY